MPAPLAKRSAQARATKEGTTLEAVLAEWAGVDPTSATPETSAAAAPEPSAPASAPAAATAAAAMSIDELLEAAAAAKGMPAPLAKRSAQARATKEGTTLEAVLAEWAGVDPTLVSSAPAAPSEAPAAPADAPAEPPPSAASDDVEVIEASAGGTAAELPDPEDAPMRPRRSGYPTWLAAAFVIIPLLAVTYILVSPNGPDCGTAGQLKVDPATGLAVNCDGSEFGGSSVDFFAQGAGIYAQCAACHGANGGGGVGPAFSGGAVLATFPACTDHVTWVALGTANFPDPTYGATNKPVGGGGLMPGYEGSLTEEQIASVALYERVAFGGQPLEEAEIDCGLIEDEGDGMVEASP
jgi:mono/diheme cytochrome c family protein